MKLLVLGGQGQLGRALAGLRSDDVEIDARGRAEVDITSFDSVVAAVASADAVINAAAITAVDRAEEDPELAFAVNGRGPGIIARACAEAGIPLVHVSTDYVFDGKLRRAYVEDDATSPLGVYGASKLAGERAIAAALDRHLIVRTAWVFGGPGAGFFGWLLREADAGRPVRVVGDQFGCPTPVGALASMLLDAAGALVDGDEPTGILHFAGVPATTRLGFAQVVLDAWTRRTGRTPPPVTTVASRDLNAQAERPVWSVLDSGLAHRALDIPAPDWREGLENLVA